jgi:hypothetical protein
MVQTDWNCFAEKNIIFKKRLSLSKRNAVKCKWDKNTNVLLYGPSDGGVREVAVFKICTTMRHIRQ